VDIASKCDVAGLVLVSPFTSMREVFRNAVGPGAYFFFMNEDMFRNEDKITQVRSPTMIVHGRGDQLIPVSQGERLFKLLNVRKLFVDPVDMEHNTNLLVDANYFVLPMLHFFPIPDYSFEDILVPPEAYDKKRFSIEYAYSSRRAVNMNAIQPPQVTGDDGVSDEETDAVGVLPLSNGRHKATPLPNGKHKTPSDASTTSTVRSIEPKSLPSMGNRSIE
jgi:hypothetical protein